MEKRRETEGCVARMWTFSERQKLFNQQSFGPYWEKKD